MSGGYSCFACLSSQTIDPTTRPGEDGALFPPSQFPMVNRSRGVGGNPHPPPCSDNISRVFLNYWLISSGGEEGKGDYSRPGLVVWVSWQLSFSSPWRALNY